MCLFSNFPYQYADMFFFFFNNISNLEDPNPEVPFEESTNTEARIEDSAIQADLYKVKF